MLPTAPAEVRHCPVEVQWTFAGKAPARFAIGCLLLLLIANAGVAATNEWWAVKPLLKPPIPKAASTSHSTEPGNPVDAFVRAATVKHGMQPATETDRRTLIRRLYFDLTGLPPSPEET